jgi:ADP-ribose pyrophosphatase YjhB (NUDIX family)
MEDINIFLDDIKLSLRSAVIIKTDNGYIFEKDKLTGIYFIVGGTIRINELSEETAKREIFEEIGVKIENIKLKAIVERIFINDNKKKHHEIGFYYICNYKGKIKMPEGFFELKLNEIKNKNVKPKVIHDIIAEKNDSIMYFSMNE